LVVAKVIPGGHGVVIIDGVREKLPRAEASDHVISQVGAYPRLISLGIEAIITGNEFYKDLLGNARLKSLRIAPFPVRFNKSKGHRFENIMAPLFKEKRIQLSDRKDNVFIDAFVDEWLNWRGDKLEKDYTNDTLDAVYAMIQPDRAKIHVTPIGKSFSKEYDSNPFYRDTKEMDNRLTPTQAWSKDG